VCLADHFEYLPDGFFGQSPTPKRHTMPRFSLRTLLIVLTLLVLYVLSFLWFFVRADEFSLAMPGTPDRYIIVFNHRSTAVHCAARAFYLPLVVVSSGLRHCPNREEHEALLWTFGRPQFDPSEMPPQSPD
jgi:hypothetical protein